MKNILKNVEFSDTELETLLLLCRNMSQRQVALHRHLDFETIQGHSKSMRAKMQCSSMATVVFRAYALNMFSKEQVALVMKKE